MATVLNFRTKHPDVQQLDAGSEVELCWTSDDTVARLRVYTKDGHTSTMVLTIAELSALKNFLATRVE